MAAGGLVLLSSRWQGQARIAQEASRDQEPPAWYVLAAEPATDATCTRGTECTQSNNKTYEEVSGEYMKANKSAPNAEETKKLGELRQSLFMGNTLRGMLLNAYAFGTMAKVALWAAIGAFLGALVFLVLALMGLRHAKRAARPATA